MKNTNIYYHPMNCNVGLSKAYNYALNLLAEKDGDDIVVWFDDDTTISSEFVKVLRESASQSDADVYVPVIYGQNGIIYSPNKKGLFKGDYIKSPYEYIPSNRFNAINSCLAVRLRVYRNYSYDENLFMDCVDTKLFDDFRKMNLLFEVLNIKIHQNFFQRTNERNEMTYWKRFEIRIKDTVTYGRGSLKGNFVSMVRIYGWAIVYGFKLKSITFFFKCFFVEKIGAFCL